MEKINTLHLVMTLIGICLLLAICFWIHQVGEDINILQEQSKLLEEKPCLQLPVSFIRDEPDCANRLLEQMGIDNVRVGGDWRETPALPGESEQRPFPANHSPSGLSDR